MSGGVAAAAAALHRLGPVNVNNYSQLQSNVAGRVGGTGNVLGVPKTSDQMGPAWPGPLSRAYLVAGTV